MQPVVVEACYLQLLDLFESDLSLLLAVAESSLSQLLDLVLSDRSLRLLFANATVFVGLQIERLHPGIAVVAAGAMLQLWHRCELLGRGLLYGDTLLRVQLPLAGLRDKLLPTHFEFAISAFSLGQ